MAIIKCPECGAEISDKAIHCPKCGAPVSTGDNESLTTNQGTMAQPDPAAPKFVQKQKISTTKSWAIFFGVFALIFLVPLLFTLVFTQTKEDDGIVGNVKYYIVQVMETGINNGIGVADQYIHSSKDCCQKVVDAFNARNTGYTARIHRVNLETIAYKNSIGQSVPVEAALHKCPLCFTYG